MKQIILTSAFLVLSALNMVAQSDVNQYVATWSTAIQLVEPHNMPPSPFLNGNSLRQIV